MWSLICTLALTLLAGSYTASAVTLDWSKVTWPAGSTSQSYEIDSTNPGNDITISMTSSSGNQFASGFPAIATGFGGSTTTPMLRERISLSSASAFVTTTINFNYTQGAYVQNLNLMTLILRQGRLVGQIRFETSKGPQ
jgi:hypothetical protein